MREISDAAQRATALTKQLLAFSRQQVLESRVLDLNEVIKGMERLLARVIGEDVQLDLLLGSGTQLVYADAGQIEQVIMNLAVNARDAMPDGGSLKIGVTEAGNDAPQLAELGIPVGNYVVVTVSDSGVGMDTATQARIFEPFFTTKDPGRGTGLGLATVFGIVAQSGGHIRVSSKVGVGTSFAVFIPRTERDLETTRAAELTIEIGRETILLVEDDDQVRTVATTILHRGGYHVLSASNGEAALALASTFEGDIHLLLTDVVMPVMNGRKLVEKIAPLRPAMRILYASGYTDDAIVHHNVLDGKLPFIHKPFTSDALLSKVNEVLRPARPRSPSLSGATSPVID